MREFEKSLNKIGKKQILEIQEGNLEFYVIFDSIEN